MATIVSTTLASSYSGWATMLFALLVLTGIIMLVLSIISFLKHRVSGALAYTGLCSSMALYTLFYALEITSASLADALMWSAIQYIGIAMLPVYALTFCLQYTGTVNRLRPWHWLALSVIPATIIVLKFFDADLGLIYNHVEAVRVQGLLILQITPGFFYYVNLFYINLLVLVALIIVLREIRRSVVGSAKKHLHTLVAGLLAPWLAHFIYIAGLSPAGIDLAPFGFAFTALLFGHALVFTRMFDMKHLLYNRVFEGINDSVILVDDDRRILDLNRIARDTFSNVVKPERGIPLESLFHDKTVCDRFLSRESDSVLLEIETSHGLRTYQVKHSRIVEPSLPLYCHIVTFNDISEAYAAETALKEKTKELDDFFASSLDMLCVLDLQGVFLHANPAWEKELGYAYQDLFMQRATALMPTKERESFQKFLDDAAHGIEDQYHLCRIYSKGGEVRWLEWRLRMRNTRCYASVRDITALVGEQEYLRQLIAYSEGFLQTPFSQFAPDMITRALLKMTDASFVSLNLLDTDGQQFRVSGCVMKSKDPALIQQLEGKPFPAMDYTSYLQHERIGPQQSPLVSVISNKVIARLAKSHPFWQNLCQSTGLISDDTSAVLVPLYTDRGAVGEIVYIGTGKIVTERLDLTGLFVRLTCLFLARREAIEASISERLYFETLFESSPGGVVILDENDRVIRCNKQFIKMFGYSQLEAQGRSVNDLIVPKELISEGERITQVVAKGREVKQETVRVDKLGQRIDVSILGKPVVLEDGRRLIYGIYIDITEQVRVKNMLISRQKEIEHTLGLQKLISEIALELNTTAHLSERIHKVIGLIGEAVDVSRVYIFENNDDQESTRNSYEWCASHAQPQIDHLQDLRFSDIQYIHQKLAGDGEVVVNRVEMVDESTRQFMVSQSIKAMVIYPLYVKQRFFGFIGYDECRNSREWNTTDLEMLRTVSAVLSIAFERQQVEQAVQEERDRANRANIAKSEFLANMSHEIRTPMNAILGFSETLHDQLAESDHQSMLQSVLTSGRSLLALLNDILDLSKIESGHIDLSINSFDLISLIREVLLLFSDRARDRGIKVVFNPPDDFPGKIHLDEIRMRQVLFNLVGNAVKFTHAGFVEVIVGATECIQGVFNINISVKDTGIGISKEQLPTIFDPFKQVSSKATRKYEGTGLGLSISKRLIEKMNGKLLVKSEEGVGSVFTIVLEGIECATAEATVVQGQDPVPGTYFKDAEVVIIDDVESNLMLMDRFLKGVGFTTRLARNGKEGVDLIRQSIPNIVVTDIRMPIMDGFAVVEELKKSPETKDIPVLACTAALIELKASDQTQLFDGVIMKPVLRENLLRELERFMPEKKKTLHPDWALKQPFNIKMFTPPPDDSLLIYNTLREQFLPEWEDLKDQLVLFQIETFAKKLTSLAKSFNFAFLESYATRLLKEVQDINLDQIIHLLSLFPEIVSRLQIDLDKKRDNER